MSKNITVSQAPSILACVDSATPIGVTMRTEPAEGIVKVTTWNPMIGANHERAMVKHVDSDFIAKPRKWGKRVSIALVEHKGKYYMPLDSIAHNATVHSDYFLRDGEDLVPVSKESIQHLLPVARDEGSAVIHREPKLEHIVSFRLNHEEYVIVK